MPVYCENLETQLLEKCGSSCRPAAKSVAQELCVHETLDAYSHFSRGGGLIVRGSLQSQS